MQFWLTKYDKEIHIWFIYFHHWAVCNNVFKKSKVSQINKIYSVNTQTHYNTQVEKLYSDIKMQLLCSVLSFYPDGCAGVSRRTCTSAKHNSGDFCLSWTWECVNPMLKICCCESAVALVCRFIKHRHRPKVTVLLWRNENIILLSSNTNILFVFVLT